jgi:reactive chlorine resistance protein C
MHLKRRRQTMTNFTPIDRSGKGNFTMFHATETLDRALAIAEPVTRASLYLSLVVIYFWFGGMKFTEYEAQGLVPLVSNSPLVGWFYDLLSVRGFSAFLGVVELSIGLLVLVGLFNPATSVLGGLLSAGLFVTTLSFMATTPGTFEPSLGFPAISVVPGQFLLKDVGLLAVSLWILADSARRLRRA